VQCVRDIRRDDDAAARQTEHHRALAGEVRDGAGQLAAGVATIGEAGVEAADDGTEGTPPPRR